MKTATVQHTPTCKRANGKQTQFDLDCERCNHDSYEAITAMRPAAIKAGFGEHTRTPWKYIGETKVGHRSYAIEVGASTVYFQKEADAVFAHLAVNCHEELIACLRQAIDDISLCNDEDPEDPISARIWQNVRRSEKAIAKAEAR